jgi:hypothetical protein
MMWLWQKRAIEIMVNREADLAHPERGFRASHRVGGLKA